MWQQIAPAFRITLFLTVLTGLIYPLAVTGVCQILFPRQANGSLIAAGGHAVGSELIGQNFSKPEYFHPRPSAAGTGYDGTASGGSNLGPTNQKLADRVKADIQRFRKENPDYTGLIPADLVTASGSGLDPQISPGSAEAQVARIAKARGAAMQQIRAMVHAETAERTLGFMGEPRVNVLALNLRLDEQFPIRK